MRSFQAILAEALDPATLQTWHVSRVKPTATGLELDVRGAALRGFVRVNYHFDRAAVVAGVYRQNKAVITVKKAVSFENLMATLVELIDGPAAAATFAIND